MSLDLVPMGSLDVVVSFLVCTVRVAEGFGLGNQSMISNSVIIIRFSDELACQLTFVGASDIEIRILIQRRRDGVAIARVCHLDC